MRNRLIHAYFDTNWDILWNTITFVLIPLAVVLLGLGQRPPDQNGASSVWNHKKCLNLCLLKRGRREGDGDGWKQVSCVGFQVSARRQMLGKIWNLLERSRNPVCSDLSGRSLGADWSGSGEHWNFTQYSSTPVLQNSRSIRESSYLGVYLNFWPPTVASAMAPFLGMVKTATPWS